MLCGWWQISACIIPYWSSSIRELVSSQNTRLEWTCWALWTSQPGPCPDVCTWKPFLSQQSTHELVLFAAVAFLHLLTRLRILSISRVTLITLKVILIGKIYLNAKLLIYLYQWKMKFSARADCSEDIVISGGLEWISSWINLLVSRNGTKVSCMLDKIPPAYTKSRWGTKTFPKWIGKIRTCSA